MRRVPARTIVLALGLFWGSFLLVRVASQLGDIITYIVVAAFFAIALTPAVNFCIRRLHLSRGWAALLVFLIGLLVFSGLAYLFVKPIADKVPEFSKTFPAYVAHVKHCKANDPQKHLCPKGPIADVIRKFKLENRIDQLGQDAAKAVETAKKNATKIIKEVGKGVVGTITVFVLLVLMLLHGSEVLNRFISPLSTKTQKRLRRLGHDCSETVTAYVFGNLLISVIAGLVTLISLSILGVKFKTALALWVGFADLIPLVGATIGAIPTVLVAFLHSSTAGLVMIIVFVVYQQFENHVLQVTIMSRTVDLDPLIVLVSVLIGVQLLGILGALLAIPAAGTIQVIVRDIMRERGMPDAPPDPVKHVDKKA
jgi:predicted PurR-regulated permease PerM